MKPNMNPNQRPIRTDTKLRLLRALTSFLRDMRLLVCCVCIAAAATSVHSESIETGLQNPVLRAHFRSYLLNATSGQGGGRERGRGRTYTFDLNTLERNVDRLAFHFLMEVSEKVADLKHTYTEVVTLRESLIRSELIGDRPKLIVDATGVGRPVVDSGLRPHRRRPSPSG